MICIYLGRRGAGKTATMVKDAYIEYMRGRRVITNMESLSFGEYMTNEDIKGLNKDSQIYNAVILIDELQIFFDSRRSMKKGNVDFSYFVQQTRKRNIDILGTTQFSNTVEKRLRDHTDITVRPKYLEKYNLIEVTYYDETSLEDAGVIEPEYRTVVYNPEQIFNMYSTENLIG